MLRYKVKPSRETELRSFPMSNFYVSPDLQFISGMTDYNVGLVNGESVVIRSPYLIGSEMNTLNSEVVRIQGKVGVRVTLPVSSITKTLKFDVLSDMDGCYYYEYNKRMPDNCEDYEDGYFFKEITQEYVTYKGDISYYFSGTTEGNSGYLIDHKFYKASSSDTSIDIDTYVFIEDGKVTIGDRVYDVDFDSEKPMLKLDKYEEEVNGGDFLGYIDGYTCSAITDSDGSVMIKEYEPKDWKRVHKFSILKHVNPAIEPEDVMFGGYRRYVTYQDENYYLKDIYDDDEYLGFGVMLGGYFYPEQLGYGNSELYDAHKDLESSGNIVYIAETDETLEVYNSLVSYTSGGKFILLIDTAENVDVQVGNFIIAESNSPIDIIRYVEEISGDTEEETVLYVTHEGVRYDVKAHLHDTVNINGNEYLLTYTGIVKRIKNDGKECTEQDEHAHLCFDVSGATTVVNGETLYFDVKDNEARLDYKIYYKSESESTYDTIKVKYGINENWYTVTENSGVTIDGVVYPVTEEVTETEGDVMVIRYITLTDTARYAFEVYDINGASTYICYPVVDTDLVDDVTKDSIQREICDIVVNNWKSFNFTLRKDTFGVNPFTPENGLMESMRADKPYTMSDAYMLENKIQILRMQNYMTFKFPMVNNTANNLRREEIIKSDFVDYVKQESINRIVDMEKDVYFPVYREIKVSNTEETEIIYHPIRRLRFNLHFRTRNLDNWKIIEDDREFSDFDTPNSLLSNWFITDYKYYSAMLGSTYLHNSSDLLGFVNFSTSEIKNQASKLAKSFLRLSYYSTNNPNTQVLLATSTIFFNESLAYKKFIDAHRNSELIYADVNTLQESEYSTMAEYQEACTGETTSQVSGKSISNFTEVVGDDFLNDAIRLSSRFIVDDKNLTDTSSEGYYIYMFKEYTRKLHEGTIYLKVEFNHAGIGKTIPFMLPTANGTPLYVHKAQDRTTLTDGFRMQDIYNQIYIPIRVIYDENSNKYVYYLPENLRENDELGVENEIMEFNLFEVKFKNESIIQGQGEPTPEIPTE